MRGWTRSVFVALLSVAVLVQGDALWAQQRPLRVEELKTLAAGGVTEKRLLDLVKEKGIGFSPTPEVLEELRRAGVSEAVLEEMTPQVPSGRSVNYYIEKGYELLSEGEAREANAYFQKVLEMEPENLEAANGIEDSRWELEEGAEMDAAVEAVLRAEQIFLAGLGPRMARNRRGRFASLFIHRAAASAPCDGHPGVARQPCCSGGDSSR